MDIPIGLEAFLQEFKARMSIWDVLFRDDREKNTLALAELGITPNQRKEVLESLTTMDYSEGPVKDMDHGPDLWVFGKQVKGSEVYIKITLGLLASGSVVCISFHISEHPMKFPLR